jgi:hypothetical protein
MSKQPREEDSSSDSEEPVTKRPKLDDATYAECAKRLRKGFKKAAEKLVAVLDSGDIEPGLMRDDDLTIAMYHIPWDSPPLLELNGVVKSMGFYHANDLLHSALEEVADRQLKVYYNNKTLNVDEFVFSLDNGHTWDDSVLVAL